jgi:histidinol phosphatase-like PHP family hydrolase
MGSLIDLHVYTNNSQGAKDKISLMCETAVDKDLAAVAFTDIIELDRYEETECRRRLRHAYFDMSKARALFKESLNVLFGIELRQSYLAGDRARQIVSAHDYDIVLTRVTRLPDGREVRFRPELTQSAFNELTDAYADALMRTVEETPFDVLCGLYAPLRNSHLDFTYFGERVKPVLAAVAAKNKAIELNTKDVLGSERLRDLGFSLLSEFRRAGGKYVTIGTGSRFHDEIGNGVEQVLPALKRAGFSGAAVFEKRDPSIAEM